MSTIVHLEIDPETPQAEALPLGDGESPRALRMLVAGDFSGRASGRLLRVDRDNFDSILADLSPRMEIAAEDGQLGEIELTIGALADFEPDSLYRKSELFAGLREASGRTFYSEAEAAGGSTNFQPTPEEIARLTSPGGFLDAILERPIGGSGESESGQGTAAAPAQEQRDELQSIVQRIVAPYASPRESAESRQAAVERAQRLNLRMARILHDERFQSLEAAWRGLDLLVRGLDTDWQVHLYLLDLSKEKLAAELASAGDIRATAVYRTLKQEPGGRWELLALNLSFDREAVSDVEMLERVSALTQALGAPCIAEWLPSTGESAEARAAWAALRKSGAAHYLALAAPRFLLRLPYGRDTAPIDAFAFEEMPAAPVHAHYLWGNPAFACALVLGKLYERRGALMPLPAGLRIEDLPFHIFSEGREKRARPSTEILLSGADCEALLADGVSPLAAVNPPGTIVFPRIRSIAEGHGTLAGLAEEAD